MALGSIKRNFVEGVDYRELSNGAFVADIGGEGVNNVLKMVNGQSHPFWRVYNRARRTGTSWNMA